MMNRCKWLASLFQQVQVNVADYYYENRFDKKLHYFRLLQNLKGGENGYAIIHGSSAGIIRIRFSGLLSVRQLWDTPLDDKTKSRVIYKLSLIHI